jgi:hypothetical protein
MSNINFKRRFVLFSYSVSHGLLLLRSGKSIAHPTRIDILFQDVRALECRAEMEDLKIEEVDESFLNGVRSRAYEVIEPGNKVYSLKSGNWIGFVVGGIVSHCEDTKHFFEHSSLLPSDEDEGEGGVSH